MQPPFSAFALSCVITVSCLCTACRIPCSRGSKVTLRPVSHWPQEYHHKGKPTLASGHCLSLKTYVPPCYYLLHKLWSACRIPLSLGSKVTSRLVARTARAILAPGAGSITGANPASSQPASADTYLRNSTSAIALRSGEGSETRDTDALGSTNPSATRLVQNIVFG